MGRWDSRTIDREALGLTIGLWTLFYGLQLLQVALDSKHIAAYALAGIGVMALVSAAGSAAIYLLMRATRAWQPIRRTAAAATVVLLVAMAHATTNALLGVSLHTLVFDSEVHIRDAPGLAWPPIKLTMLAYGAPTFLWIYGMYAAGLGLMFASAAARARDTQLAEARATANRAQLDALRFQLNPHFLFNTLNAISSLMVSNRAAEAERMLEKLSDFLRSTLVADSGREGALEDELDVLDAYLAIEAVRFGDRMEVGVECPHELRRAQVPTLILQPLVENAVKHAVAPARRPVTVRISASAAAGALTLLVADDGEGPASGRPPPRGAGVGLANVRQRLEVLYGDAGRLETGAADPGFWARIVMPLTLASAP